MKTHPPPSTLAPTIASLGFVLISSLLLGCAAHLPPGPQSNDATAKEFQGLYTAWHREIAATGDYSGPSTVDTQLPAFEKIVALGKPALPYLKQKLEENQGDDCFLAFAVVEICGWNPQDFATKKGMRDFRANVLRKMQEIQ